jgi:hypothetical protein
VIPSPSSGDFGVEWQPVYPMSQKEEAEYANQVATGASTVTGGVPEEAVDVNEWRNMIHLPPRTTQQMDDARERTEPQSDDKNEQTEDERATATGETLTEKDLLAEDLQAVRGKGFSKNSLLSALEKLLHSI